MKSRGTVVTIGIFDGVHVGHSAIIRKTASRGRRLGLKSVVLTFDPHPLKVLRHETDVPSILSLGHRVRLILALGVDEVVVLPFTKDFSRLSAEAFTRDILVKRLRAREAFVAENFRFGRGAGAGARGFAAIGKRLGLRVNIVPTVKSGGKAVSSSRIRSLIVRGDITRAARLLGRPVSILGTVVKGSNRGRFMGFPTANIDPHHEAIPPSGVYAVRVRFKGRFYGGVLNIGVRPTFFYKDTRTYERTIEVHIFGFGRSIYGEDIEILFIKRLRPERAFRDPASLAAQIKKDAKAARNLVKHAF